MVDVALGARPLPVLQCQPFVDMPAMAASFRRRGEARYLHEIFACPLTFVLQLVVELADTCICHVVGQMLVLHHSLHIQVFHTDRRRLVFVGEIVCQLMYMVVTLVGRMLMQPGYAPLQHAILPAALLLLAKPTLQQFHLAPLQLGVVRRLVGLPVAQHGKMLQPHIYADGLVGGDGCFRGQRLAIIHKDADAIHARRQQFDGHLLDAPLEVAMESAGNVLYPRSKSALTPFSLVGRSW